MKVRHSKRKSINLRVLKDDLQRIKIKALQEEIPYQTLIGSVLHKYAHIYFKNCGDVNFALPIDFRFLDNFSS